MIRVPFKGIYNRSSLKGSTRVTVRGTKGGSILKLGLGF